MKSHFNKLIGASFAMALALLGLIGIITYRATTGLARANETAARAYELQENLDALLADLARAESAERGFIITGRESFLEPYRSAINDVKHHTKRLHALCADFPDEQAQLAELNPLVRSRLAILKQNISLRTNVNGGFEAAQQQVAAETGKHVLHEIRRVVTEMQSGADSLRQSVEGRARLNAQHAFGFAWGGTAVSVLLLALCFRTMRQEIAASQRAESEAGVLNRNLREQTADLEAANRELESFANNVSHDLRAPLRHVGGFVNLLGKQLQADDPNTRRYLRFIGESVQQMSHLVDNLLSFSRMSRTRMNLEAVDLNQLVADVRKDLAGLCAERRMDWRVGALPTVQADAAMLSLAFLNLLGNAVKYTAPRAEARIEVGCDSSGREHVLFVRDNGVGFDMKFKDKLFRVFQRLHAPAEFEGTGIGLANVRRIIERHGGRTWAEGRPDGGATFYFSLPKTASARLPSTPALPLASATDRPMNN